MGTQSGRSTRPSTRTGVADVSSVFVRLGLLLVGVCCAAVAPRKHPYHFARVIGGCDRLLIGMLASAVCLARVAHIINRLRIGMLAFPWGAHLHTGTTMVRFRQWGGNYFLRIQRL
jgi:hypothetical protein